jgi:hypothetical protein
MQILGLIDGALCKKINQISKFIIITKKNMLTKEKLNNTVNELPDSFTIDELIDQLIFIEKVEEGIKQSDSDKIVSNEDVKLMIDKWSR